VVGRDSQFATEGGIKWVANASGCSATAYDLYMYFGFYTGANSFYTVETSGGTWTHLGTTGQTNPGPASATVLIPKQEFNVRSGSLVVDNSGNVGIGTTGPSSKLEVVSSFTDSITMTINNNDTSARAALFLNHFGTDGGATPSNSRIGAIAFRAKGTDGSTTFPSAFIDSYIGTNGTTNAPGDLRFHTNNGSGTSERMRIDANGNVGIGTTNPSFKLHVVGDGNGSGRISVTNSGITSGVALYDNGTIVTLGSGNVGIGTTNPGYKLDVQGQIRQIYATSCSYLSADSSGAIYCNTSSLRYKTNIKDLNFDIDKFLTLNPKSFDWNTKTIDFVPSEKGSVGFIAEEVEKVIPQLVRYKDGQVDGVKYDLIPVYMFKVIKEQQRQIQEQQKQIEELKSEIEELKKVSSEQVRK
jgi:hypothetical protein